MKFKKYIFIYLILSITFILYCQVIYFQFCNFDTPTFILDNNLLQRLSLNNIVKIFTPGATPREQLFIPITYFSYLLEISLFGLKSSVMHFDNLLLHIINIILVYLLLNKFFELTNTSANAKKDILPCASTENNYIILATTALFALHPLQVESVCWIMGRKDLLACMLALLAMLSFLCCLNLKLTSGNIKIDYKFFRIYKGGSLIFFVLACLSKPTAIILPLLFILIYFYFFKAGKQNACAAFKSSTQKSLRYFFILIILVSVIIYFLNSSLFVDKTDKCFQLQRILFLPGILCEWINRIFLIIRPEILYSWTNKPPLNAYQIIISLVILLLVFLFFIKSKYKNMIALCFAFSIICFLPSLNVLFTYNDIYTADRYGYFGFIGIFATISLLLFAGRNNKCKTKVLYSNILYALILGYMILCTYNQIEIWNNSETLWKYVLIKRPNSPTALNNLAAYYWNAETCKQISDTGEQRTNDGNIKQVISDKLLVNSKQKTEYESRKSVASGQLLKNNEKRIKYNNILTNKQKAVRLLLQSYKIKPLKDTCYNLGTIYLGQNNLSKAEIYFKKAVELTPNNADYHGILGTVYLKQNKLKEALKEFEKSAELKSGIPKVYMFISEVYYKLGNRTKANEAYQRYISLNSKRPNSIN